MPYREMRPGDFFTVEQAAEIICVSNRHGKAKLLVKSKGDVGPVQIIEPRKKPLTSAPKAGYATP